ncbi:MAG: hypothetical protein SGJ27_19855 [Candidatus Melainabacteria bacterium]|nr:hypothetical protein [Candidatus Melainabacteria bacterium]
MTKRKKSSEFNFDKDKSAKEQTPKASLKNFGVTRPGRDAEATVKPADLWDLSGDDHTSDAVTAPVGSQASTTPNESAQAAQAAETAEAPEVPTAETIQPSEAPQSFDFAQSKFAVPVQVPVQKPENAQGKPSIKSLIDWETEPEVSEKIESTEVIAAPETVGSIEAGETIQAVETIETDGVDTPTSPVASIEAIEPVSDVQPDQVSEPVAPTMTSETHTIIPELPTAPGMPSMTTETVSLPPTNSTKKNKRLSVLQQVTGQALPSPQQPAAEARPNIEFEESSRNNKTAIFEKPSLAAMEAAAAERASAKVQPPIEAQQPPPTAPVETMTTPRTTTSEVSTSPTRWLPPPRKDTKEREALAALAAPPAQPVSETEEQEPDSGVEQLPAQEVHSNDQAEPHQAPHTAHVEEQPEHQVHATDPEETVHDIPPQLLAQTADVAQTAAPTTPSITEVQAEPSPTEFHSEQQPAYEYKSPTPFRSPSAFKDDAPQAVHPDPVAQAEQSASASQFNQEFDRTVVPESRVHKRTIVQEFDITKLLKETQRQTQEVMKLPPEPEFDSAMHYFSASAERMTYTAELRFRANYTPAEKKEAPSEQPPEAAWNHVADENSSGSNNTFGFKFLNDFTPPKQDLPVAPNTGFNMLDLIDEGYRSVQPNPTFSQTRGPGKVEVAVDWVNSNGRLPPASREGLAAGLGATKAPSNQYKKSWSKK